MRVRQEICDKAAGLARTLWPLRNNRERALAAAAWQAYAAWLADPESSLESCAAWCLCDYPVPEEGVTLRMHDPDGEFTWMFMPADVAEITLRARILAAAEYELSAADYLT